MPAVEVESQVVNGIRARAFVCGRVHCSGQKRIGQGFVVGFCGSTKFRAMFREVDRQFECAHEWHGQNDTSVTCLKTKPKTQGETRPSTLSDFLQPLNEVHPPIFRLTKLQNPSTVRVSWDARATIDTAAKIVSRLQSREPPKFLDNLLRTLIKDQGV